LYLVLAINDTQTEIGTLGTVCIMKEPIKKKKKKKKKKFPPGILIY
jgi:hypothetical protein